MSKILLFNNFINDNFGELLYKHIPESYTPFEKVYDKDIGLNIDAEEFEFIEHGDKLILMSEDTPFEMLLPLSILTIGRGYNKVDKSFNNTVQYKDNPKFLKQMFNPYRIETIKLKKGTTPISCIKNSHYSEFPKSFCETFVEKIRKQYPDYDVKFFDDKVFSPFDETHILNIKLEVLIDRERKVIKCLMINDYQSIRYD